MQKVVIQKIDLERDFALGVYLSEAQNPVPPPPPPYKLYTGTCIQFTYSHREGGRGGESWTREKGREATVHKAGSKIPKRMTVSPVYYKHLPQIPFTGQFFTFCFGVYIISWSMSLILCITIKISSSLQSWLPRRTALESKWKFWQIVFWIWNNFFGGSGINFISHQTFPIFRFWIQPRSGPKTAASKKNV